MQVRLLFSLLLFSIQAFPQAGSDSTAIAQLLVADYKTMATWDLNSHIQNITNDYILIEKGKSGI